MALRTEQVFTPMDEVAKRRVGINEWLATLLRETTVEDACDLGGHAELAAECVPCVSVCASKA